jgi:hypothetical protein
VSEANRIDRVPTQGGFDFIHGAWYQLYRLSRNTPLNGSPVARTEDGNHWSGLIRE